ncbi:hypothetical protein [Flavobacterium sp. 245]|uniref:hypothetical protein n=1 Tax=Flavobacterium sp. 245 TaxID=2512115 RepID=UPI00105C5704|nr:hypothetical protein [Flavobacterium sp. 245]
MKDMTQTYLLEWLDSVVTLNFNPKKNDADQLTTIQCKAIVKKAIEETQLIQTQLTIQVFSLNKEKQIKVLVKNYHSALISLWDQLITINNAMHLQREDLKEVVTALLASLDELLTFIESRFTRFLSLDSRIPVSYLGVSSKKMRQRLDKLRSSPFFETEEKLLVDIVFNSLYCFVHSKKKRKVTFRDMLYQKSLIRELESLTHNQHKNKTHVSLIELLIYMNFNSKIFINYYTQKISRKIDEPQQIPDKMECLLFYFKEFSQITIREDIALHSNYQNLKKILREWFEQEIIFQEKKQQLTKTVSLTSSAIIKPPEPSTIAKKNERVVCQLSTDQTALILRASSELEILISKSMNHLFKTIVPFLSTPNKDILSYDSMRSKAYSAEDRDKEIAIATLEKMIKKIKEY